MKYKLRFILCAVFAFTCFVAGAQTVAMDEADSQTTDEQVQVAFRQVAPLDLLGGVSVLNVEALMNKNYEPNSDNINLQGYVGGFNGNSLWGMDADAPSIEEAAGLGGYLVLIDGVPRDNNNVLPTEIAQVTILKGAQALVLYGSRAAKGAMLITTKRGQKEGLSIDVRANTGFNVSKSYPEYLGSAEYMQFYNEARLNDGSTAAWSQDDLYNYNSGINPARYPDVDFYSSEYIRKAANRSDITAEIEGGGERAKFYSNINYYRSGDLFKIGEAQNNFISRLGFRGNVDMKISDMISAYANTSVTFYDSSSARGANYWSSAATLRPHLISPLIPIDMINTDSPGAWDYVNSTDLIDGRYILGGTSANQTNVFGDMYESGRSKFTSRQFQFDTGVKMDLGGLLEGLSFDAKFAVDYATRYTSSFNYNYSTYAPEWANFNGPEMIAGLTKYGSDTQTGGQTVSDPWDRQTMLLNAQFNYQRTFNDVHNVSGLLLASGWQRTNSGQYQRPSSTNLGLQGSYNYDHRYYLDASVALVHSAKLAKGNRKALSPSVTLGWRLSEEGFLKDSSVIDDLMLSVSGSILNEDSDIDGYFVTESNWGDGAQWSWFYASKNSTSSTRGGNSALKMLQRKEVSATLRTSLFDRLITADVSFFKNRMSGYLVTPTSSPSYMTDFVAQVNNDEKDRVGMDFSVNLNKRFGEVDFSLGVFGTWYDTQWAKRENDVLEDVYAQKLLGRPLDGLWGLQSDGLFQSQEEIDIAPTQYGTLRPGDIKYVDQNGDNVINDKDEVYLGKSGWYGSPFTLGMNLTLKWKSLTFFALGTGGFGGVALKSSDYYWISGEEKYSAVVRDRTQIGMNEAGQWEVTQQGSYPRLTVNGTNNFRNSDYWLYKNDRFNLAKVQITYDLPKHLLENALLKELSIYVSGANLLTISKERKHMEMNVGSAPQTRFYNIGVRAMF